MIKYLLLDKLAKKKKNGLNSKNVLDSLKRSTTHLCLRVKVILKKLKSFRKSISIIITKQTTLLVPKSYTSIIEMHRGGSAAKSLLLFNMPDA